MMTKALEGFKFWLRKQIFVEQLSTPVGFVLMMMLAVGLGYVISVMGLKVGALLLVGMIAIPLLGACLFEPMIGICISMVMGVLVGWLTKYREAPFGMTLDALLFVMFFGLLIRQVKERDFSFAKSPISAIILVWVFYNLLQVLNPDAASRLAWLFTVRTMAGLILLYFIACYALNSLARIKFMLKFIVGLAFVSALYGLKQEFIGFSDAEITWLNADEKRYQLIVQWSRTRIFSFFSDPTTYGIYMSYMAVFCMVLMTGPISWAKRAWLGIAVVCMMLAMAYAGSRTPFVLVPFGIFVFLLMTLKKEYLIVAGVIGVLGMGVLLKSTSNAVVYRIQSAFLLDKSDDTMQVRYSSQRKVRPFIYSHPFGAGLGATGVWGARFSPDHWLSKIAHDSALVRIAIELGLIGALIFVIFLLTIVRTAVYYYIRVKDPLIKTVYLAITCVIFMLILASYPQEAIPILPTSVIFYTLLGIIVRLKDFDPAFRKDISEAEGNLLSA